MQRIYVYILLLYQTFIALPYFPSFWTDGYTILDLEEQSDQDIYYVPFVSIFWTFSSIIRPILGIFMSHERQYTNTKDLTLLAIGHHVAPICVFIFFKMSLVARQPIEFPTKIDTNIF